MCAEPHREEAGDIFLCPEKPSRAAFKCHGQVFSFAVPIPAPEELRGAKARSMEIRCSAHFRGQFRNGLLFEVSGHLYQTDQNINLYIWKDPW